MQDISRKASLVVVGCGIKFFAHLTNEVIAYIKQSDVVLYLVNDPVLKLWIQEQNQYTESLDNLYLSCPNRADSYQLIADYVLNHLYQNKHICFVLYGHPSVYAKPGLDAVKKAKQEGYYAKILPAISAEACLFADLLIDPGSSGCQSFEASDFLIHQRQFDISSHLILWQINAVGILNHETTNNKKIGILLLLDYLKKYYEATAKIVIYEAAQYPGFEPKIIQSELKYLSDIYLSNLSTLYIPPVKTTACDQTILKALKLEEECTTIL
ncbi:SAM-dependent methyltransferase [Legionella anisa]|uniref:Uroporphyrinogen III methylase n=1 Tax=Legionella anisa TaxID=28082 RepID=A0AAX0WQ51_9GAMM|nr:SAM-dependent methyltransferase [Legionella anisa]AWN73112.1 uroporphyrinogen III methylase [Legionella anisa]KTC67453.1 uroporphyrinogen III methylase [Legionella anisa]MCW8423942.1 SAM-dependent methyltransferase [Legionella anisa]MCW8447464.1 SAM-dependent methyltransferase [Legionella anisa]PNL60230.1 uroporphyrinogen III methylase [Legionella anisa]